MLDEFPQPPLARSIVMVWIQRPATVWAMRIVPPLLLLWPLSTRSGTLLYLCGM